VRFVATPFIPNCRANFWIEKIQPPVIAGAENHHGMKEQNDKRGKSKSLIHQRENKADYDPPM